MAPAILNSQSIQVALPVVLTLFIAASLNGRGVNAPGKRTMCAVTCKEVNRRLDRIDEPPKNYGQKIAVLEERSSPLGSR